LWLRPAAATAAVAPPATTTPAATRAKGTLSLALEGVFGLRTGSVTITGRAVRVNGIVRPYVPGQTFVVHAFVGRRLIKSERVKAARSPGGTYGHFSVRFPGFGAGQVFVSVVHASSPQLQRLVANGGFGVLTPSASFGSSGRFVQLIQSRLRALHLYIPQSGVYDGQTGLALDAYHRLLGWGTSQTLDRAAIASLMAGVGAFRVRYAHQGRHAEANLGKQLLALADGSQVLEIYPTTTSTPRSRATTQRGCSSRTSSSTATRSTGTTRYPTTRRATGACGCRSPTRSRSSTGSGSATASTSTTSRRA
jgi:hypothetical protein